MKEIIDGKRKKYYEHNMSYNIDKDILIQDLESLIEDKKE